VHLLFFHRSDDDEFTGSNKENFNDAVFRSGAETYWFIELWSFFHLVSTYLRIEGSLQAVLEFYPGATLPLDEVEK
jgi:hypothetical protein